MCINLYLHVYQIKTRTLNKVPNYKQSLKLTR